MAAMPYDPTYLVWASTSSASLGTGLHTHTHTRLDQKMLFARRASAARQLAHRAKHHRTRIFFGTVPICKHSNREVGVLRSTACQSSGLASTCPLQPKHPLARSFGTCARDGCDTQPVFGSLADGKAIYCKEHKRPDDVDVVSRRCQQEGCDTHPVFGSLGDGQAIYCKEHK